MPIEDVIGLAGVAVIAALVSVSKPFLPDDTRLYPPVAIAFGLAINIGAALFVTRTDVPLAVVAGVVAGLAASGLYSVTGSVGLRAK